MSKEIILKSLANDNTTVYVASAEDLTVRDILNDPATVEHFGADCADDLIENFVEFNGAEVPEALANTLLGVVPNHNDVIGIDLALVADDDEEEEEDANTGSVTIYTVGGQQTILNFEGRMTVREAVTSDAVQLRSRQSKAQLSACPVVLNGQPIDGVALDSRILQNGDVIVLSPARNAGDKGRK